MTSPSVSDLLFYVIPSTLTWEETVLCVSEGFASAYMKKIHSDIYKNNNENNNREDSLLLASYFINTFDFPSGN